MTPTTGHRRFLASITLLLLVCLGWANHLRSDEKPNDLAPWHIKPPYAWNRTDKYQPPNFEEFFPDDAEAGKQLDLLWEGKLKDLSTEDRLALIRKGLRHTSHYKTTLLGAVGNEFVWNKEAQDPRAIELLYHASAASKGEIAHYALYHGPTVVSQRTPNLVRMLMELYAELGWDLQHRIPWGMKSYGDKEQTRKLLLDLLSDYKSLDAGTVGGALDVYKNVFDQLPPDMERFDKVGQWVIVFHRDDLSASHPRASKILYETVERVFRGRKNLVLDFVTRVDDGHETAVVLLDGFKARSDLASQLPSYTQHHVDRNEMLTPRILRECRLREFAKHLPNGLPANALPTYTRPPIDAKYAYSSSELVPPNYDQYFPDDPAASKRLDELFANQGNIDLTDRELLDLFRNGVCRSSQPPNAMFGWISSALGWPRDPMLTEILYQALDPKAPEDFYKAGNYYGFGLGTKKTKNIITAMFNLYMTAPFDPTTNGNLRSRILWGVRDHEDDKYYMATLFEEALRAHADLSDSALRQAESAYETLTGTKPPNAADYAARGVYLIICRDTKSKSVEASQQRMASYSNNRVDVIDTKYVADDNNINVLFVVRGKAALESLGKELMTSRTIPIDYADLLSRELISNSKSDVLRDLEKHLPAKSP